MSHFLLTESNTGISKAYILAVIFVGIVKITLALHIPTLAFTEKKCVVKIVDIAFYCIMIYTVSK